VAWPLSGSRSRQFETVSADKAARLREEGAQVVDVREPEEWRRGHIPGSLLLPLRSVAQRGPSELDPGRTVLVVCASGHRSKSAARTLGGLGLTKVYDLHGGLAAWSRLGLPVER
jgi:rhodanese-related sulfurtransferase